MMRAIETFWQWRFKQARKNMPLQLSAVGTMILAVLFAAHKTKAQENQFHVLKPLILDPFFVISVCILAASHMQLDYMEYKVKLKKGVDDEVKLFARAKSVPRLYRAAYGSDLLLTLWSWRFVYIACALIALVRWFAGLKGT